MGPQKTPNSQIQEKKEQSWSYHITWLRVILQSYDNQNSMVLAEKDTQTNETQFESPEIKPQVYGQMMFDKGAKNTQWRKESLFTKWCCENWKATCKTMKVGYMKVCFM